LVFEEGEVMAYAVKVTVYSTSMHESKENAHRQGFWLMNELEEASFFDENDECEYEVVEVQE
jgi:hypothetical protein